MKTATYSWLSAIVLLLLLAMGTSAVADQPSLRNSRDFALQRGLEQAVSRLGLMPAVKRKALTIALVDITDTSRPRLASVNGDEMMYAASLPKIAILLGAFQRIADGSLAFGDEARATLTRMIRNSSNTAATEMLHRVGMAYTAELLQSPRYRLYSRDYNGGLWVGKEYGKGRAWKRDPLHHLSHGATALQVARFYYLLDTGRLVSPQASREMKAILGESAIHHKFVKGLEEARPGARVFRKSGTWRTWHADSAIVERDDRRYIAVALAHDARGGEWLRRLIVALDDLIAEQSPTQLAHLDGMS
ncbi:MAG: serine hydrolase [Nitrospirota bacterium]